MPCDSMSWRTHAGELDDAVEFQVRHQLPALLSRRRLDDKDEQLEWKHCSEVQPELGRRAVDLRNFARAPLYS